MGQLSKDSKINGERIIHEDIANEHYHHTIDIVDFGTVAGKDNNKDIYAERIHDHTLEDLYNRYLHDDNNIMEGYLKIRNFDDDNSVINKAYADDYAENNIVKNNNNTIIQSIPVNVTREPRTLIATDNNGEIHWSRFHINNIDNEFRPALDGPKQVSTENSYQYFITNYNSFANYTVTISEGTATIDEDVINITVPSNVSNDLILTITTDSYSSNYIISVVGVSGYDEIVLNGPESVESNRKYEFTIANYDSSKTYTVSTNIGSADIIDDSIIVEIPSGNSSENELVISINDGNVYSNHNVAFIYNEIVLNGPDQVESNTSYEYTITNYDSRRTYYARVNIGTVSISGDKLTLQTPNSNTNEKLINIIVSNDDNVFTTHSVTYLYDNIILHSPERVIENQTNEFEIYNYNHDRSYTVTSSTGTASIDDNYVVLDLTNSNVTSNVDITVSDGNVSTLYTYPIYEINDSPIQISGPSVLQAGNIYSLTIDNYDENLSYSTTSNVGNITLDNDNLIIDLSEVNTNDTLNLTLSNDNVSTDHSFSIEKQLTKDLYGILYSVSGDNTVKKLNNSGQELWSYNDHDYTVWCIDIDNNGNVYTGSADHTVKKLDVNGNKLWSFKGHTDIVWALIVDNENNIYTGSFDDTIRKIDNHGNELWVFDRFDNRIRDIEIDSANNIYAGSSDNTIRKIDTQGNQLWLYRGNGNDVISLAIDNEDNIYSASFDNEIQKLNSDAELLWSKRDESYHSIRDIEVDSNNDFYIVSHDDRIRKYDKDGIEIWSYDKLEHNIWALDVDENKNIYTGSQDNIIRKFEPYGNSIIWEYTGHNGPVYDITVNPVDVVQQYDDIILVGPTDLQVGNVYTFTIDNYDPNKIYNAVTSMGEVDVEDDKLTLDLTGFTLGGVAHITITDGYVSTDYNYDVEDHESYDQIILLGPQNLDAGNVYTYTIDNYFPQRNYSATTDIGSVSVSDDTLTLDLSNIRLSQVVTITVTDQHISSDYSYDVKGDGSYDKIVVTGPDPVKSDNTYEYTINNYYESQTYNVSTNIGDVSINGDTITLNTPDYNTEERDLTITVNDGDVYSDYTVTYLYDVILLEGPESLQAGEIYSFKITNYVSGRTYEASATLGEVSINGDELIIDLTQLSSVDTTTITISDENVSSEYSYDIEFADGINIYTGSFDNTVRKLDNNGYEIWAYRASPYTTYSIDVDKDGYIYTALRSDTVDKIDNDLNTVWSYLGHDENIYKVVVDEQGNVYTGSKDTTVRKLSPEGEHIWTYSGHNDEIWAISVDDEQGHVYTGSKDGTIKKLNSDAEQLWVFEEHTDGVRCLALHYDSHLFSGSLDNTVRKISLDGAEIWSFTGHSGAVFDVATDHNDNIYSGSVDETIRKIDYDGNEVWSYNGHSSIIYGLETDHKTNIYTASNDRTAKKIHPDGYELWTFKGHTNTVRCITVDPIKYDEIFLEGPDPVQSNNTYEYTITNYYPSKTYEVSSDVGSVSIDGDTVTLETPDSNDEERDITISINDGRVHTDYQVTYLYDNILLEGPDPVKSDNTYEYTITNYVPEKDYSVSTDIGSVSIDGDTVTLETPDSNDEQRDITISINDGTVSSEHDVAYLYDDILLEGPDPVKSDNTYEYTITNYVPEKDYSVSTDIGSVSIDGDTVTLETPDSNDEQRDITISINDGTVSSEHDVAYVYDEILLEGPDPVKSNKSYEYTIINYEPQKTYNVSTNIGSVSVNSNIVTLETPTINNDKEKTITIDINDGDVYSDHDVTYLNDELIIDGPDEICSGSTQQYDVYIEYSDGSTNNNITTDSWTTDGLGTVDSNGQLSVDSDVTEGDITLSATVENSIQVSKTISIIGGGIKIRQVEKINNGSTTEVYFDVIDPVTGESVTDITQQDICGVTENGNDIPDYTFGTSGDLNKFVDIGISLDRSGSFSEHQQDMNTGASSLIDRLSGSDMATIVNFGSEVSIDQGLSSDKSYLKNAINNPSDVGGGTALYDSIVQAVNELQTTTRQKAIMVVTDGNDGSSTNSIQDAIDAANNESIPIFLIAFGSSFDQSVFQDIANQTNGNYDNVSSAAELTTTMENFRNVLSQQYVIKYDSDNSDSAVIELCVEGYCNGSVTLN